MTISFNELAKLLESQSISISELLQLRQNFQVSFKLHPLGFLACTLMSEGTKNIRLHYWTDSIIGFQQSSDFMIHDHSFEFKSWILSGSVENIIYSINDCGDEYSVYSTVYEKDSSILIQSQSTLRINELNRKIYNAGDSYCMSADTFHKTIKGEGVESFTVLLTNNASKKTPTVLGSKNNGNLRYEYQRKTLSEEELTEKLIKLASLHF